MHFMIFALLFGGFTALSFAGIVHTLLISKDVFNGVVSTASFVFFTNLTSEAIYEYLLYKSQAASSSLKDSPK